MCIVLQTKNLKDEIVASYVLNIFITNIIVFKQTTDDRSKSTRTRIVAFDINIFIDNTKLVFLISNVDTIKSF